MQSSSDAALTSDLHLGRAIFTFPLSLLCVCSWARSTVLPFPLTPQTAGWTTPAQLSITSKCSKPFSLKVHLKSCGWQEHRSAEAMDFYASHSHLKSREILGKKIPGCRSCEAALPDQSWTRTIPRTGRLQKIKLIFHETKFSWLLHKQHDSSSDLV